MSQQATDTQLLASVTNIDLAVTVDSPCVAHHSHVPRKAVDEHEMHCHGATFDTHAHAYPLPKLAPTLTHTQTP